MAEKLFSTKRYIYKIAKDYLDSNTNKCCLGVLGVRRIGKTVLLKQLANEFGDKAVYFDLSRGGVDLEILFNRWSDANKQYILLDEVCKLDSDGVGDLVYFIKSYCNQFKFVLTGSVVKSVERICDMVGRGTTIELVPITYAERLSWDKGVSVWDDLSSLTSYDKLVEYLKWQNVKQSKDYIDYIGSVVTETLLSYHRHMALDDCIIPDKDRLLKLTNYFALCQFVYKKKGNTYVDIPTLSSVVGTSIPDLSSLKVKYGATSDELDAVTAILSTSGLVRQTSLCRTESLEKVSQMDNVPAVVFEFPWFVSYALSKEFSITGDFVPMWLENALLLRAILLYDNADKYRSMTDRELDIIYDCKHGYSAIEVKARICENTKDKEVRKYKSLCSDLGINELILTCTDEKFKERLGVSFYRADLVMLALEKAYFDRTYEELLNSNYDYSLNTFASELIKKYCSL